MHVNCLKYSAKQLIDTAIHPKFKAALAVAYGAGLRVSEVVNLKVGDVDSKRRHYVLNKARADETVIGHYPITV